ncbi:MAG: BREX-2 system adenine-specific DNA-methyltransferase PglX [Thermoleophilaceae bacterium]
MRLRPVPRGQRADRPASALRPLRAPRRRRRSARGVLPRQPRRQRSRVPRARLSDRRSLPGCRGALRRGPQPALAGRTDGRWCDRPARPLAAHRPRHRGAAARLLERRPRHKRFLGDLYQDLSEAAKKRYALLQTPEFVEEFILDRTLDPAIEEFGLDAVRMIDPTCGSGHFLIGGFHRLFARWREREPGSSAGVLAQRALEAIYGVDLNPYATAIARFRLVIAALRACGVRRLGDAPALRLNLATGDSLLHGPERGQFPGFERRAGIEHVYDTEDAHELARIFGQGYHAVVGNPPYITGSDEALRAAYRSRYTSCHREFALTVPFMERFFELARPAGVGDTFVAAGFVGKITGNSFMRREFGTKLVNDFFPAVDLQTVVDSSAAHIPGHGTPTVLLFGRSRPPTSNLLRVVDSIRTEATQPKDASRGLVWLSIEALVDRPGEQDEFVRATDISRGELLAHPVTLGPGREVLKRLESEAPIHLADLADEFGYTGQTNIDDTMLRPHDAWGRALVDPAFVAPLVVGDAIRDWGVTSDVAVWFPYRNEELVDPSGLADNLKALWPWRTSAWARRTFSKQSYREEGRTWYEWHQVALRRHRTPLSICWAFVATHNHFVLDRGAKVFKQSALLLKLPAGTSVDEHLALLGVLNSSAACFWLKQVTYDRGGGGIGGGIAEEAWERFFELSAVRVQALPLPEQRPVELARELDRLATARVRLLDGAASAVPPAPLAARLADLRAKDAELFAQMASLQEEIDWQVLRFFDLVLDDLPVFGLKAPPIALGLRAFEIVLARQLEAGKVRTTWFERHGSTPITQLPDHWPDDYRSVVEQRIALIESDPDVGLIERPEHKRRWAGKTWEARRRELLESFVLDALEELPLWGEHRLRSTAELTDAIRADSRLVEACELLGDSPDVDLLPTATRLVAGAAVPFLAALRYKPSGLRKRAIWERVWDLQRAEDRIGTRQDIPVPPRYASSDFRSQAAWKLRGKLDVPKERFVLYPGAERGADSSPVVGWAGWSHREQALALAARVLDLREREDPDAERLTPLLAGLLELLPWIHQWDPDAEPDYGGPPGDYFESWLDQQLAELVLTRESLRAWRPQAPARGRRARAAAR